MNRVKEHDEATIICNGNYSALYITGTRWMDETDPDKG